MVDDIIDLPVQADPVRLAKRHVTMTGRLDLNKLTRLMPLLAHVDSVCQVVLTLSLSERGLCLLEGQIKGCLQLVCQRCLGPFEWSVELPIKLAVIKSEVEEGKIPSGFDALFMSADSVNLSDVVEDELLLNAPNYPVHADICNK